MSNTLLAIQAYAAGADRVRRHWPYYKLAGCDIVGFDREDQRVSWPDGILCAKSIGKGGYVGPGKLCAFLLDCFDYLVRTPLFDSYTDFCVVEHDAIFLKLLPPHPGGLVTHMGGHGGDPNFRGQHFYHCPWWADRTTATKIVDWGSRMLRVGLNEHDFPDRFLGLMADLYDLPITSSASFSVNAIDTPSHLAAARASIRLGAYFVHGVKTEEQLRDVTAEVGPIKELCRHV